MEQIEKYIKQHFELYKWWRNNQEKIGGKSPKGKNKNKQKSPFGVNKRALQRGIL